MLCVRLATAGQAECDESGINGEFWRVKRTRAQPQFEVAPVSVGADHEGRNPGSSLPKSCRWFR